MGGPRSDSFVIVHSSKHLEIDRELDQLFAVIVADAHSPHDWTLGQVECLLRVSLYQ